MNLILEETSYEEKIEITEKAEEALELERTKTNTKRENSDFLIS
jgi:hypothetical protein